MITDEQMAKLPKWAQAELDRREVLNRRLQKQLDELTAAEPSPVMWSSNHVNWHPVPKHARVRFEDANQSVIDVKAQDGGVYISGSFGITIQPHGSNAITVKVRE